MMDLKEASEIAEQEYKIVKYISLLEEELKSPCICPNYQETLERRLFLWEDYLNEILSEEPRNNRS